MLDGICWMRDAGWDMLDAGCWMGGESWTRTHPLTPSVKKRRGIDLGPSLSLLKMDIGSKPTRARNPCGVTPEPAT